MNILDNMLVYLIGIYILVITLIPDTFTIYGILLNGNILLDIIVIIFILKLLICQRGKKPLYNFINIITNDYVNLTIIVFSLIMVISITYSQDKTSAINESYRLLTFILLFMILKYDIKKESVLSLYLKLFILASIIVFLSGIFEYAYKPIFVYKDMSRLKIRTDSILRQANNLGVYTMFIIFPSITMFTNQKGKKMRIFYGFLASFAIINMFLSGSRNAIIGLIIGILLLIIIYNHKLIRLYLILPLLLMVPQFRMRFNQIGDMSQNYSRIKIWKTVLYMIKDHPLKGIGIGNFYYQYPRYVKLHPELTNYYDKAQVYHSHDLYLKLQSETGIIGLLSFICFIAYIFIDLKNLIKLEKNKFILSFYSGFTISLIVFLEMNILDNFFSAPKILSCFWILLGIMEGCLSICKKENSNNAICLK